LTSVEKLFHLNAKTSGEATAIVAKSPLTNEGFDSAWAEADVYSELGLYILAGPPKLKPKARAKTKANAKA